MFVKHAAVRVLLIAAALGGCARYAYPLQSGAAEVLEVRTSDGWTLALHHFPPPGPARPTPVVLCHGVTANLHNWDVDARRSLPRYLARRGFDTYVVELRAAGQSSRDHYRYGFDDYVLRDLPAVVDHVAARGSSGQVHWVGHSLGGMVMYGYLQRVGQRKVRSLTAVGSPPMVIDQNRSLRTARALFPIGAFFFDRLPSGSLSELGAPLADHPPVSAIHLIWNPDNVDPDVARAVAANATNDTAMNVMRLLVDAGAQRGHVRSIEGDHDYTDGMRRIEVPVLFVAGSIDALAPPAVLAAGFRAVASEDKAMTVFGRANGHRADYGHVDLAIGEAAPDEVFPRVARWLEAHE